MNKTKHLLGSWIIATVCIAHGASAQTVIPNTAPAAGNAARAARNATPVTTTIPIFNSPEGPVILFGNSSIHNGKDAGGRVYTLSRALAGESNYKELPLPGMAASLSAFKKSSGADMIDQLRAQLRLKTTEALWAYILQHPLLADYGLSSFNPKFRRLLGAAYLDEAIRAEKGRTYTYKLEISDGKNGQTRSLLSSITIGKTPEFGTPLLAEARSRDSMVVIHWRQRVGADIPFYAYIYRQTGGKGEFVQLPTRILATRKKDSLYFLFTERLVPHSAYSYFIRPADLLENSGATNSDTAHIVTADFHKLPLIAKLKARDTLDGIYLSWAPLKADPLLTGIEIQRSRDPRGDYAVMDTVSAIAAAYLDKKLLPHVNYYYRLCALHIGRQGPREKFYSSVSMNKQQTPHDPDAPYGIKVTTVEKGVRISWRPVNELDLYGYYVYRGLAAGNDMRVISLALHDTVFTDTTSNLSRQIRYVYAVKAITNAGRQSPFSEKMAALLPLGREKPRTPGGISLVPEGKRLLVQWEDVKKSDASVFGYILYKRKADGKPLAYDAAKPASVEATRLHLSPVLNGLISMPYFEDTVAAGGAAAEYLVSAIDRYGVESGLSPVATTAHFLRSLIRPPAQLSARRLKEGIALQWEDAEEAMVKGFSLYRRGIGQTAPEKIASLKGDALQYLDRSALPNGLYVYTVTAITDRGESPASAERTIRR